MSEDKYLITGGSGFIGTHLIENLLRLEKDIMNIDTKAPLMSTHNSFWKACDILEREDLLHHFRDYQPTHVVHLAARTDMDGKNLADYLTNTQGTLNVLSAVKATPSTWRVIITSSQYVHRLHGEPKHPEEYAPHTIYGESKVLTEVYTRKANLSCVWTIIRPTNIWGPWHPRYPEEFWLVLKKGRYLHPGHKPVMRTYGYVGNVVYQILKIFELPPENVHRKVLYVGDKPINLLDWVNGFSKKMVGKEVTIAPRIIVRNLALIGDILLLYGIKFPITSSRYKNMTTNNDISMNDTFNLLGPSPYSMQAGIDETVRWLIEKDIFTSSSGHEYIAINGFRRI
jgi:nucleoside-diphosphate-sugar epimerase